MISYIQKLVSALREELKHYGEMLALLEHQQEAVISRVAGDIFESVHAIQIEAEAAGRARKQREECQREVGRHLCMKSEATLSEIQQQLPSDYRPLMEALVQENNQLLQRVQQKARQNHLLLSRSIELMQRFMSTLFPGRETVTYRDTGVAHTYSMPSKSYYEAVG
jgi:flagellar biosynthesis/type III secretory pathway chaperone